MGALRDYLPLIVMVPGLAGIHYGWYLLQQNEKLVPKHQQVNEQPIITVGSIAVNAMQFKNGLYSINFSTYKTKSQFHCYLTGIKRIICTH